MLQLLTRTTLKEDKKGTSGDDKKYIGDQDHCHHDEQEQHLWDEVDLESVPDAMLIICMK